MVTTIFVVMAAATSVRESVSVCLRMAAHALESESVSQSGRLYVCLTLTYAQKTLADCQSQSASDIYIYIYIYSKTLIYREKLYKPKRYHSYVLSCVDDIRICQ